MQSQLIHGDSAFEVLASEWDELAGRGMTDTPFQSLAYQRSWWRNLHPADGCLHTIAVREPDGKLAAIACLYNLEGVLYFNGCTEETDYLDLIVPEESAESAWSAVLDCLHDPEFPDWNSMDLCNVPAASQTRTLLPKLGQQLGISYSEQVHEVCPIIRLPESFEDYLAQLPKKQRHEIRRKLRRADGAGVKVSTVTAQDDLTRSVDEFLELLQASTPEKRDWLNDGRRAVFHEIARASLDSGNLRLMFAEVNGQKGAALFNFAYNNRIWVYNSGLEPTDYGGLSLGVVVTARAIEQAIEERVTLFDFLRGSETYKYRFGAEDTEIYRISAVRNRS